MSLYSKVISFEVSIWYHLKFHDNVTLFQNDIKLISVYFKVISLFYHSKTAPHKTAIPGGGGGHENPLNCNKYHIFYKKNMLKNI